MLLTILKQILIILAGIAVVIGVVVLLSLRVSYENRRNRRWESVPIRYQLLYLVIVVTICGVFWFFSQKWNDWYYEKAPVPYASVEAAAADGCLVVQAMSGIMDGEENWEAFLQSAKAMQPTEISIAIHDGGAVQNVNTLAYDGLLYHYTVNTRYIHQDSKTETYPFLLCLTYEPPAEENAMYVRQVTWVLTDNPNLTGQELANRIYGTETEYTVRTLIEENEWLSELR